MTQQHTPIRPLVESAAEALFTGATVGSRATIQACPKTSTLYGVQVHGHSVAAWNRRLGILTVFLDGQPARHRALVVNQLNAILERVAPDYKVGHGPGQTFLTLTHQGQVVTTGSFYRLGRADLDLTAAGIEVHHGAA